ncbi:MAG TPA: AEC family transporter [Clostridia bacterium]|nr:AEC family transporter [Clostridia bacterium]HPQ46186.1 AEC family transporter [Clostridia bacterium]HRX41186.1 AEC family transporter [Clostridia bacterium]
MTELEVLLKVIPLLTAVVLGYVLYKKGFIEDRHIEGFKKIVVNVTLPAGLLVAFASIDFKAKYLLVFATVFIACLLMFLIAQLAGRILKIKSPYFPFLMTGFEAGMMGYALYGGIHGLDRLSEFGIIDVGQVLFVFIVTVPLVSAMGMNHKGGFLEKSFKSAVKSPVIWSIFAGLLISVTGLGKMSDSLLYKSIADIFDFISKPTPVLISIVIGSGLKFSFASMKKETLTASAKVLVSIIFAVLITFLVLKPLGLVGMLKPALLTMFVLPGPFVIPVFMDPKNRSEVEFVSNTLSIGTLLALAGVIVVSFL